MLYAPDRFQSSIVCSATSVGEFGHVADYAFLYYAEIALYEHLAIIGVNREIFSQRNLAIVAVRHELSFSHQVNGGDSLDVTSDVFGVSRTSFLGRMEMTLSSSQARAVAINSQWVWIDSKSGKPRRHPVEFRPKSIPKGNGS
jgi:acyl-CoA thioesterase FadM